MKRRLVHRIALGHALEQVGTAERPALPHLLIGLRVVGGREPLPRREVDRQVGVLQAVGDLRDDVLQVAVRHGGEGRDGAQLVHDGLVDRVFLLADLADLAADEVLAHHRGGDALQALGQDDGRGSLLPRPGRRGWQRRAHRLGRQWRLRPRRRLCRPLRIAGEHLLQDLRLLAEPVCHE
jgi:hypothetical protein